MIIKMTHTTMKDFNKSRDSFTVSGRIIPKFEHDKWTYTEEVFSEPYIKQYEHENIDLSYIDDDNKAVYLYYDDNNCIGQISLRSNWNGYTLIEDIAVAKKCRQKGIGKALLQQAVEWARQNNCMGLMLETQDVNVSACRFYAKNNFVIGGVDTMLYSKFPTAHELAIYWYHKF